MDAKQQALNIVAQKHGYKDWNTLWWEGEITIDIMEDALETYGSNQYDEGYNKGSKVGYNSAFKPV